MKQLRSLSKKLSGVIIKGFNGLFTKYQLRNLLTICTKESHFQFKNEYYDQVDGVAMGSPLGPLFANAFMYQFEKIHMPRLRELGIKRWHRYVDDIFATLNNKNDA